MPKKPIQHLGPIPNVPESFLDNVFVVRANAESDELDCDEITMNHERLDVNTFAELKLYEAMNHNLAEIARSLNVIVQNLLEKR